MSDDAPPRSDPDRRGARPPLVAVVACGAVLAIALAAVYAPVVQAGFFYLDDDYYVTDNPVVRDGLTASGLLHAFFGSHGALWMPLAFTSHMLDVTLFGSTPTGPHVVNVLLHVVNALLLLGLLVRATGALAPSLVATAFFALHPLRVESVAWIAERKDVLSALFGLATLHAWVSWVRGPSARRWGLVVAWTVLALATKPMLVTLPVLLLCFDWWPLRRVGSPGPDGRPLRPLDLVREKRLLLALAAATATITLVAARAQGALVGLGDRPLPTRLAHAAVTYVWYAWKTACPTGLAVFYPYPEWTAWQVAGAVAVLATAAGLALAAGRTRPWIAAGLAWFAAGLVPVIGVFQAGGQGMADRFTYLPGIGLVLAAVWTVHERVHARMPRAALAGATALLAVAFGVAAHRQATYWRSSEALFVRTLAVTERNWRVERALGDVLENAGRHADAYEHYARVLAAEPDDAGAHYGVGIALDGLGRPDEAVAHYREALRLSPTYARAHNNLGVYLVRHGDVDGALHHFSEAVAVDPRATDAVANLRSTLALAGFPAENVDGYVSGLRVWGDAVSNDRDQPGGDAYVARLARDLAPPDAPSRRRCTPDPAGAPFSVYVEVDAAGALTALTAMPPTAAARCLRDELRTAHAPPPPFAPFHAKLSIANAG